MYPIFLKLAGSRVAVIGAGVIAERKIRPLLDAGAEITVIAPCATAGIMQLAENDALKWKRRPFRRRDVRRRTLLIAATSNATVNARVYKLASRNRQLVNSVDDPAHCNFYVPAIVNRNPLLVAISTSGRAPFLAKHMRRFLEKKFYPGIGSDVEHLGKVRDGLLAESNELNQDERSDRIRQAQEAEVQSILDKMEQA